MTDSNSTLDDEIDDYDDEELDAGETGEQCIYCLRYTYQPGYGCLHCGRGLASDEVERYGDE